MAGPVNALAYSPHHTYAVTDWHASTSVYFTCTIERPDTGHEAFLMPGVTAPRNRARNNILLRTNCS